MDLDLTQPFTHAQARGIGLGDRLLRELCREPFPGVFVRADIPDTLVVRSKAALLAAPAGGTVSHHTAARLLGAHPPASPDIHVSYPHGVGTLIPGIKIHRFTTPFESTHRHGIRVTTPCNTFMHLTRPLSLVDLVAVGDRFVHKGVALPGDFAAFATGWAGQGREIARRAGGLVRANAESVPETCLRMLLVLSGIPEPTPNLRIDHPDGSPRYRLDLAYPESCYAIEYNGRWHDSLEQKARDERRRCELEDEGWTFEIVTADHLYRETEDLLHRLHTTGLRLGVRMPLILTDEWRRHFPAPAFA